MKIRQGRRYEACISGYYGMQNSGDDALLAATLWGAREYLGLRRFAVTSSKPVKVNGYGSYQATVAEQQRFRGQIRLQRYQLAANSQHVIFGGGSVLHTEQDISVKRHMLKLAGGKSHAALGVGIGPFENQAAELQCQRFLNECAFVGLRDQESLDVAKAIAPQANCQLSFDLAPLLLCDEDHRLKAIPRRGIAVALCPLERLAGNEEAETDRIKRLARSLTSIAMATGEPIYLVDMNGHEQLGDHQVHHALQRFIPANIAVFHVPYDPNPVRVLQRFAGFNMVIAMRLHASILSFLARTPVVQLNYHSKCEGWAQQIGIAEKYQFDCRYIEPMDLIDVACDGLEQGFTAPDLSVNSAIKAAKRNWEFQL